MNYTGSFRNFFRFGKKLLLNNKIVLAGGLATASYFGHTLLFPKVQCTYHYLSPEQLENESLLKMKTDRSKNNFVVYVQDTTGESILELDDILQALKNTQNVEFIETNFERAKGMIGSNFEDDTIFIARNEDHRLLIIKRGDQDVGNKLFNFFRHTTVIHKENLADLKEKVRLLQESDRIVYTYIPDSENYKPLWKEYDQFTNTKIKNLKTLNRTFQDLKYEMQSNNAHFVVLRDYESAQYFNVGELDVGEVYIMKKTSHYNNYDTNNRIEDVRVDQKKLEPDEYDLVNENFDWKQFYKQALHINSIDTVNMVQTENEIDHLLKLCNYVNINKFVIVHTPYIDDSFQKAVLKLSRAKKEVLRDFNRDDFCVVVTPNPKIAQKKFGIIPNKYEPSIRFIDKTAHLPIKDSLASSYKVIDEQLKAVQSIEELTPTTNPRYVFKEKPTKNRFKKFINDSLQQNLPQYSEKELGTGVKYSHYITGESFREDVIKNKKNVMIEFFKPTCPACFVLSKAYERFASIVEEVQALSDRIERGEYEYTRFDDNVINRYHIKNIQKFRDLTVGRYNIYNESSYFPSPSTTPLLFVFKKADKSMPILIDLIEEKVKISDTDRVVFYLLRYVDEKM